MSGAGAEAGLAAWARTSRWNPGDESWGEPQRFRGHAGPGRCGGGRFQAPPSLPSATPEGVTAEDGGRRNQPQLVCVCTRRPQGSCTRSVHTGHTRAVSFHPHSSSREGSSTQVWTRGQSSGRRRHDGQAVYERAFTFRRKCDACIYASYTRAYPFRLMGIHSCVHEV